MDRIAGMQKWVESIKNVQDGLSANTATNNKDNIQSLCCRALLTMDLLDHHGPQVS